MLVAPYTISKFKTNKGICIYRIKLLCQGGEQPWAEEEQPIEDVLEPNGIFSKTVHSSIVNNTKCMFVEVDTTSTDMNSMYTWHELERSDKENLCWRTFTFGISGQNMWLPLPNKNECTPIIEQIYKLHSHI